MFARFILKERPNAKIGTLWENNDMGREELDGVKLELGDRASKMIIAEANYLLTDPTVNS